MDSAAAVLSRYADMVYRLAFARTKSRYDADDILQEVFLRYIRSAPDFQEEEHCRAWLIRTTVNCSKTLLMSAWFRKTVPLDDTLVAEMRETGEVYDAVLRLPKAYRTVVHLYYYEGYKTAQIARILRRKEATVRSDLRRGREKLREILREVYDFEEGV